MSDSPIDEETKHRHVVNAEDAREQASEGSFGFLRSEFRVAKGTGEVFEIPHKDLFDNDQQDRWDDLMADLMTYDRHPDAKNDKGEVVVKGRLIQPHHKGGVRVRPSWQQRLAIVLWGEEGAQRARDGGIALGEIELIWAKQEIAMRERASADPKSGAGSSSVAPASN